MAAIDGKKSKLAETFFKKALGGGWNKKFAVAKCETYKSVACIGLKCAVKKTVRCLGVCKMHSRDEHARPRQLLGDCSVEGKRLQQFTNTAVKITPSVYGKVTGEAKGYRRKKLYNGLIAASKCNTHEECFPELCMGAQGALACKEVAMLA